jgi:hypothetical protein
VGLRARDRRRGLHSAPHDEEERITATSLAHLAYEYIRGTMLLQQLNQFQGLRYIKAGAKVFPSWAIVEPLAVRLHQAVAPLAGFKTFHKSYGGPWTANFPCIAIRALPTFAASSALP